MPVLTAAAVLVEPAPVPLATEASCAKPGPRRPLPGLRGPGEAEAPIARAMTKREEESFIVKLLVRMSRSAVYAEWYGQDECSTGSRTPSDIGYFNIFDGVSYNNWRLYLLNAYKEPPKYFVR